LALGIANPGATTLAASAWASLRQEGKKPEDISVEDITKRAIKNKPIDVKQKEKPEETPPQQSGDLPQTEEPDSTTPKDDAPEPGNVAPKQKKGFDIEIWKDENGGLMVRGKDGATNPMSDKKAGLLAAKYPDTFGQAMKNAEAKNFEKPGYAVDELAINPFQPDNFLF
jgi:hypothetical protein